MTVYRATVSHPGLHAPLTIERRWFSELFTDLWALAQEGCVLVGEPVPVTVDEREAVSVV